MPKFLILQSPNKGNVGTITHRDAEDFYKPTFYRITDEEIESYTAMNTHAKNAFIAEKLEAQLGTPIQIKKKVAPIVEVVESQVELVSVEMPETEVEEPFNEPINYSEQGSNIVAESANEKQIGVEDTEEPKAKGRPKKVK